MKRRYQDFNSHLRKQFGCRVQKIALDAGLGCPNRDGTISTAGCIYCDDRGSGSGAYKKGLSISEQISRAKDALRRRYKATKFIAYFQAFTNTYGPLEKLKGLYEEALKDPDVVGISIGTRPDCIENDVIDLLETYTKDRLVWIEYGLQSTHNATLSTINRGHDWRCFVEAVERTHGRGIQICTHIILGLPGEGRDEMMETARQISGLGIDGIKIHSLYIVRGTRMEDLYDEGKYSCLDQDEYAKLACDVLEILPPDMVIQRLTGDPNPAESVAPSWALKKSQTLRLISDLLEGRDSYQGKHYSV
ncbi:MAG: TIGR01212 family radical SAM protein [Desulfatiglandales bacterium]